MELLECDALFDAVTVVEQIVLVVDSHRFEHFFPGSILVSEILLAVHLVKRLCASRQRRLGRAAVVLGLFTRNFATFAHV